MGRIKVYVEKVYTKEEEKSKAVLLKFQNGQLQATTRNATQYTQVLNQETQAREALVVANASIYRGSITEKPDELRDTYICVRSRITNKMRIYPIENARLTNELYYADKEIAEDFALNAANDLRKFTSRKGRRLLEYREMKINTLEEELQPIISNADTSHCNDVSKLEASTEGIRPVCNVDATKVCDLYNVHDIVPENLLDRMDMEAEAVLSTDIAHLGISSDYLKKKIVKIQNEGRSFKGMLSMKLIIYMDALLNLVKSRARTMDKVKLSRITEKVEEHIRDQYADPNSGEFRVRSVFSKEKAICHFLVLAFLTSDNFQINAETMKEELGCGQRKLINFIKEVFAQQAGKSNIMQLTLPSQMATPAKRTPRKKL